MCFVYALRSDSGGIVFPLIFSDLEKKVKKSCKKIRKCEIFFPIFDTSNKHKSSAL